VNGKSFHLLNTNIDDNIELQFTTPICKFLVVIAVFEMQEIC